MKRLLCAVTLALVVSLSPVKAGDIPFDRGCNENCPPPPCTENCMMAEPDFNLRSLDAEPTVESEIYLMVLAIALSAL